MAQWGLSSYLVVVRSLQALATLISAILNGFLLVYIETKRLGPSDVMLVLEIMVSTTIRRSCLGATRPVSITPHSHVVEGFGSVGHIQIH